MLSRPQFTAKLPPPPKLLRKSNNVHAQKGAGGIKNDKEDNVEVDIDFSSQKKVRFPQIYSLFQKLV